MPNVAINGSASGSVHTWHIHQGSCGEDSPVVGVVSGYTPIPVGGAGESQLMTQMPIVLRPGEQYFVHVLSDASYAATGQMEVAACGALIPLEP